MDPNSRRLSPSYQQNGPGLRSPADAVRPDPLRPLNAQAARFEDEKRRIMSTCFAKRDETGKLIQSYITHIKVDEDAAYQSSPPPPDSNPQYKKPRVIILAVKTSGRVSMHKARENGDGSFQIGKTWGLEELQSIESFASSLPKTPEQQQRAAWAGPMGFLINMSKPYYWCAKSPKEKDFFIGSLVKVYSKFTGGKVPELIGFDQKDKDFILASLKPSGPPNGNTGGYPSQSPMTPQLSPIPTSQQQSPLAPPDRPFVGADRRPSSNSSNQDTNLRVANPTGRESSPSPTTQRSAPTNGGKLYQSYQTVPPAPSPAFTSPSRSRIHTPQLSSRPSNESGLRQPPPQSVYPLGNLRPPGFPDSSRLTPQASQQSFPDGSAYTSTSSLVPLVATPDRRRDQQPIQGLASNLTDSANDASSLSSSTTSRWKPSALAEDVPTKGSSQVSREPYPSKPAFSYQATNEAVPNGSAHALPERRRPPLQDSYNESDRMSRPESTTAARRPQTPAGSAMSVDRSDGQTSMPQPPSTVPSGASTPSIAPVEAAPERSSTLNTDSQQDVEPEAPPQEDMSDVTPQYRPGLGPMTGRKIDVANKFRKAATAHRAFVPRAGGAGDRMFGKARQSNEKNEPDGITGVVPARSVGRNQSQDIVPEQAQPQLQPESESQEQITEKNDPSPAALTIPAREEQAQPLHVVDGNHSEPLQDENLRTTRLSRELSQDEMPRPLVVQKPQRQSDRAKAKPKANPFASALLILEIDPAIGQDQRAVSFENNMNDLGWKRGFLQKRKFDALQANMRKEVTSIEAGTWLGHSDHKDERIDAFEKSIDKAIAAVDDMDGLLTLYSVELGTLVDDVAYIEAQSQGLQVQTANQKLLHSELENLVNTVSLDSSQLEPLRVASLGDAEGQEAIESSLSLLYRAIQKIDPAALTRSALLGSNGLAPSQGMRALQERKEQYIGETNKFLLRLKQYVDPAFSAAFRRTQEALQRASTSSRNASSAHDEARKDLWKYHPMLLFVKELDMLCWREILKVYQNKARELYQEEIRDSISEWKKRAKSTLSEEQEALFTNQEREHEGLATTARKMTVKRSATLAKSLRQTSYEKRSAMSRTHEANLPSSTVFAGVLRDLMPSIAAEQNFVTDFFHATGVENLEFVDAVILERPNERHVPDLSTRRAHEVDRTMASAVNQAMDAIFASWSIETHNMLEWAIAQGPFQSIGVLASLERARLNFDDTNQEYLIKIVQRQRDFLLHKFEPFISEQINAIESVKIKTNKRRGIMSFTRVFPLFAITIENTIPEDPEHLVTETRKLIDDAYTRIINTIFRALDSIAKDATLGAPNNGSAADPEDKEALNALILLIENTYHLYSEIEANQNQALLDCRRRAEHSMLMHRDRYVAAVIRRPLGRLLDFLEQVESDRRSAGMATHSRPAFKKILSNYDAKSVRRDIDALKKRVEKHFSGGEAGGEDHAGTAGGGQHRLAVEVLEVCEKRWIETLDRTERICKDVYEGELVVEYSRQDVTMAFRR